MHALSRALQALQATSFKPSLPLSLSASLPVCLYPFLQVPDSQAAGDPLGRPSALGPPPLFF